MSHGTHGLLADWVVRLALGNRSAADAQLALAYDHMDLQHFHVWSEVSATAPALSGTLACQSVVPHHHHHHHTRTHLLRLHA